jgi:membrane-bound lytic murein transglycosylase D
VAVSDLADANQLSDGQSLSGMEALAVPVAPAAAPAAHTVAYTARRGDTLVSIADRFGVSLDQLRRWNKIPSGTKVTPGQRLHVAEPAGSRRTRGHHRTTITAEDLHPHAQHSTKGGAREAADPPAKGGEKRSAHAKTSSAKSSTHAKSASKKQK